MLSTKQVEYLGVAGSVTGGVDSAAVGDGVEYHVRGHEQPPPFAPARAK